MTAMKIDPTKGWYSAQELAGLPGMPTTDRRVRARAEKNLWISRKMLRGKGVEYSAKSLPAETRQHIEQLAHSLVAKLPATAVAQVAPTAVAVQPAKAATLPAGAVLVGGRVRRVKADEKLSDRERAYRDAAIVLCRAVEAAQAATDCSVKRACRELAARLVDGEVSHELRDAAQATYLKPRKGAGPFGGVEATVSRLQKLMGLFEQGRRVGDPARYLVPGMREKEGHNPVHVAAFLRFYCHPTRPPVAEAYRRMVPFLAENGLPEISYTTVCRIEASLPVTVKYRGRVTGSEWRGLKPYIERDVSMFKANDIWVGDGHSFKAKIAHPQHGQPFVPEVTVIIDWVSRKIVGWSASLSESTVAVSDAFRHAQMTTRARPLVYYSDNGSGQTGKMIDCPIAGTLARQGIAHETGIPGNPQARGIIERLWQVTLIPLARTYPTCTWRGADDNAVTKMLKLLNRKDQGGIVIPSWRQFLDDVAAAVERYNLTHEHRELAGLTPEEAYQAKLDRDSIVFGPSDAEIAALWMPEVVRKPRRGLVEVFGNTYCKRDLVDVLPEGSRVRVRYDLHNAEQVWLLTMDGVFLGTAKWNGHAVAAFPVAEIERKRAERVKGMVKRGEEIIRQAQAELGDTYDLTPAIPAPVPMPDFMPVAEREPVPVGRGNQAEDEDESGESSKPLSWEETIRMLYRGDPEGDEGDEGKDDPSREVAAG